MTVLLAKLNAAASVSSLTLTMLIVVRQATARVLMPARSAQVAPFVAVVRVTLAA